MNLVGKYAHDFSKLSSYKRTQNCFYFLPDFLILTMSCCPSLALSWVVLVYEKGIVKADVPFRKTKSKHNVKQVSVIVKFYGGELEGVSF